MLWERFGWWSIAAGVVLAGVVDVISIGTGSALAGYPNYLIVWASFHQFGYAWLDGRLATAGRKLRWQPSARSASPCWSVSVPTRSP